MKSFVPIRLNPLILIASFTARASGQSSADTPNCPSCSGEERRRRARKATSARNMTPPNRTKAWSRANASSASAMFPIPTIAIYRPPADKDHRRGRHHLSRRCVSAILAMDLEGTEVCEWLNSIWRHRRAVEVSRCYRAGRVWKNTPLRCRMRNEALSYVRFHARRMEHRHQPHRHSGGFSAGGHLSAAASTHLPQTQRTYEAVDEADTARL